MSFERTKFKRTKHTCEKCGRKFTDKALDYKRTQADGSTIENEFIPACPPCFKKILKNQRKVAWLHGKLTDGLLTTDEISQYASKKISEQKLNEIIRSRKNNPLPKMTEKELVEHIQAKQGQFLD